MRARALSVRTRQAGRSSERSFELPWREALERADAELDRHGVGIYGKTPMYLPIETDLGTLKVEIASATISLVRKLQRVEDPESAARALEEADRELDVWESHSRAIRVDAREERFRAVLPFGVQVQLPERRLG